jgi:hypothetical protein
MAYQSSRQPPPVAVRGCRHVCRRLPRPPMGTCPDMKLMRSAAMAGVAKKVYDEARKPHNQAKIKSAVEKARARRGRKQP